MSNEEDLKSETYVSADAARNSTERFENISIDFITILTVTKENHDAVMVIVNKLTKLVMIIPIRTDMDAVETAMMFFNHWYR
jgi:hypothetical protein